MLNRKKSTEKSPKAGRANFQHQRLTGKGNINKMSKKDVCVMKFTFSAVEKIAK